VPIAGRQVLIRHWSSSDRPEETESIYGQRSPVWVVTSRLGGRVVEGRHAGRTAAPVRIALLGTRGVPARYGGFETAAEEIGARLATHGHHVVVYCRNPGQHVRTYRGMELVNLPAIRSKSLETISHTALSTVHAVLRSRPEVVVLFNPANGPFVPILRAAGIRTVVHFDGLDAERAKWGGLGRAYLRAAARWSVRLADDVIADSEAIAKHIRNTYGRESTFIAYGAPILRPAADRLPEIGLVPGRFHLVVSRFEPENNLAAIVEGYGSASMSLPLVVVGSARHASAYRARVMGSAGPGVRFLGVVWDQELLDQLYGHCATYVHGHSVGGTNPSLLRAMGAGAPIIAYDVVFNRETARDAARYFRTATEVASALTADEGDPVAAAARGELGRARAADHYVWDDVARGYEALCERLLKDGRR
jgi:glycosyltransferase involved in cell wall biosynthesis